MLTDASPGCVGRPERADSPYKMFPKATKVFADAMFTVIEICKMLGPRRQAYLREVAKDKQHGFCSSRAREPRCAPSRASCCGAGSIMRLTAAVASNFGLSHST
jgi:hypothetical protein